MSKNLRIGIFTHYIDKYRRTAPSLYQMDFIKRLINLTNLEIFLLHHRKTNLPIYKLTSEILIPKPPYLREHYINQLDLDVVHFNAIPWSWWPTITKLNVPLIATVHGTIHWDAPRLDDYTPLILRTLKRNLEKYVAKHITYFIAISKYVSNVLVNKLSIPSSKIEVVYPAIDCTIFKPLDDDLIDRIKSKYNIKSNYILHVSNFSKKKNPDALIKIFAMIKKKIVGKGIELVIVGSGWNKTHVNKMISKFDLWRHIKILGWVPIEDLVALYNGAELLLHPSMQETFCFPLIEAIACGCPVVASGVTAIPEVVGNAALLCNPHDHECFIKSVLKILSDPQIREKMVKKGLERAKLFDWNLHIKKLVDIYKKSQKLV